MCPWSQEQLICCVLMPADFDHSLENNVIGTVLIMRLLRFVWTYEWEISMDIDK